MSSFVSTYFSSTWCLWKSSMWLHVVIIHSSSLLYVIPLYATIIHSVVDGHLICLQFLAIKHTDATSNCSLSWLWWLIHDSMHLSKPWTCTPQRMIDPKKTTPGTSQLHCWKLKIKRKTWKQPEKNASSQKGEHWYKLMADFSSVTKEARRQWDGIFKMLKGRNSAWNSISS